MTQELYKKTSLVLLMSSFACHLLGSCVTDGPLCLSEVNCKCLALCSCAGVCPSTYSQTAFTVSPSSRHMSTSVAHTGPACLTNQCVFRKYYPWTG